MVHDVDLEEQCLTNILDSSQFQDAEISSLMPDLFYDTRCRQLAEIILDLYSKGEKITLVTADAAMRKLTGKRLPEGCVVKMFDHTTHADIVAQLSYLAFLRSRRLACMKVIDYIDNHKAASAPMDIDNSLLDILQTGHNAVNFLSIPDIIQQAIDRHNKAAAGTPGILTGFHDLDRLIVGFQPGDIVVIGARPSVGKSQFAWCMAENMQKQCPVLFFACEMKGAQLGARMLANHLDVPLRDIRTGKMTPVKSADAIMLGERKKADQIYIDDSGILSTSELLKRITIAHKKFGIKAVFIDHLDFIRNGSGDNRNAELSDISKRLKTIAKKFGLIIVEISQLSRENSRNPDKRPMLTDLRDSGSIEQDADIVIMLYREDYQGAETTRPGVVEVIVRKCRDGEVGTIEMFFDKARMRYTDIQAHGVNHGEF